MSISIDLKSNKRLMSYYQSNDIGNSFKSIIHVVLKIQLPDKIWALIKEFSIMNEEQLNWCRDANRYGAAISLITSLVGICDDCDNTAFKSSNLPNLQHSRINFS